MTQIQQPPSLGAPILNEKPGLSSDPKPPTVGSTINEKSEKAAQLPNGDSSHDHYHRQHDNGVQDDGSLPKSLVQKEKRPNGLIVDEKVEQPKANGIDHESPPTSTSSDSLATPKPYEQPSTNATPAPPAVPAKDEVVASPTEASPISKPEAQTQAHATAKSTPDAPSHPQKPVAGPSRHVLATYVASNPTHTVKEAIRSQFPKANPIVRLARRFKVKHSVIKGMTEKEWAHYDARGAELRKKAGWKMKEGEEGKEVSELFWKMYLSLMPTLERDPLSGLTTPDLLGSTATIPLTVISLIPDIMRHYREVIIRAEKEVFLATNYWQPSNSVNTITGSLKELSDLVMKRKGKKIVVKIMYDRGSVEQLWNSHAPVDPSKWESLDLPTKESVPGLELEVINFHRVLLGTFHAKFLIVDRKVALVNSNNIQDRPNLELMSHLEGPIVDSFYEVALHSWYNRLEPPLPCIAETYTPPRNSSGEVEYLFSDQNPYLQDIEIIRAAKEARSRLRQETMATDAEMARAQEHGVDRLREAVRRVVDQQRQSLADWRPGERIDESVQNAMHELREIRDRWAAGMSGAGPSRSRPNSRGPSRRSSAHEGMLRSLMRGGGDKPGEYTISHAPLNANPPPLEAESEAPSSPTMTDVVPTKSHTAPPGPVAAISGLSSDEKRDTPAGPSNDAGNSEKRAGGGAHVAFAPLDTDFDGSGRFMEELPEAGQPRDQQRVLTGLPMASAAVADTNKSLSEKPVAPLTIPKPQFGHRLTASPASGSVRLPDSPSAATGPSSSPVSANFPHRRSVPGSPILKPTNPAADGSTSNTHAGVPTAGEAGVAGSSNDGEDESAHVAFGSIPPAKNSKTLAEKVADRTVFEELNAEAKEGAEVGEVSVPMPLPRHVIAMTGDEGAAGSDGRKDKSETATLEGLPIGAVGPGGSLSVAESEVPEGKGTRRLYKMSKMFNAAGVLSEAWATVEDSDELDNFRPHVIHSPHEPVPVAMCCRKPHGFPGHHDIRNPQNAAWLAGFRYAKRKVFIQSPTLNARPIVRAIKQACRRGVEVVLLLDLGFNDKGESIPFQGGTNEEVVDRLYKILRKEKKEQHLKVYWYTGKDQVRPLNAVKKQRNCHIKFAAYDDQVLIIGNGNQDSQSWFHSQEVNVMVDSKQIVAEMMVQLLGNQNTIEYGLVDTDGIWRDSEGKTLKDYGATDSGKFRGLAGFIAFAKTI